MLIASEAFYNPAVADLIVLSGFVAYLLIGPFFN